MRTVAIQALDDLDAGRYAVRILVGGGRLERRRALLAAVETTR